LKYNNKYTKLIITTCLIAYIVIYFFFLTPNENEERSSWQNEFNNLNFSGVIVKKYLDHSQHSTPIIELKTLENNEINKIDLFGDRSSVFDDIKVGDTLVKKRNSDSVFIVLRGNLQLVGRANFLSK